MSQSEVIVYCHRVQKSFLSPGFTSSADVFIDMCYDMTYFWLFVKFVVLDG